MVNDAPMAHAAIFVAKARVIEINVQAGIALATLGKCVIGPVDTITYPQDFPVCRQALLNSVPCLVVRCRIVDAIPGQSFKLFRAVYNAEIRPNAGDGTAALFWQRGSH